MKSFAKRVNKRFYYGWVIVFVSALGLFFSAPGQTYSISVFIDRYQQEFGFSSTLLSTGYTVATILSGTLIVFMGKFVDRFGQRVMMVVVGLMLAATVFYNSFVLNIGMIFVGFFLLRYFGQGSMVLVPNSLVPQWFDKRRALAISLMTIGAVIAMLAVPSFNYWLIDKMGWESAWRVWGVLLLVFFIPFVLVSVVNRPEDIGITIENENNGDEDAAKRALEKMTAESFTLEQALKTKEFWFIGLMSLIVPMFSTGITFHFYSMMNLRNVPGEQAALIIGLLALPAFAVPFVARLLIDRLNPKYLFFTTQTMFFLSMALLAFFVQGFASATFFILFYGTFVAIQQVALNAIWPRYFGREHLGSIRGGAHVFMVIGSSLGPLPFGLNYDLTGGYTAAILGMMAMTIVAALLALSIKKPEKEAFSDQ